MKSVSLSRKETSLPLPKTPSLEECRGISVPIVGQRLSVTSTITPAHRSLVKTMSITCLFWKDLFSLHNLFTCDKDGRGCSCKNFFNPTTWTSEYEDLASEIEDWSEAIDEFLDRRDFLFEESERFDDLHNIYKAKNSLLVEWQAHHAYNEHMFLFGQLCHACSQEADNYRITSWSLLNPSATQDTTSTTSTVPHR